MGVEAEADYCELEGFLARRAGADTVSVIDLRPLGGGAIQDNRLLVADITGGPFTGRLEAVLRRDAPSKVAESHSREHEFALLEAAHGAGVTVPEPLWLCTDGAVLGRPFFVMRRLEGVAAGHRVVRDAALGGERATLAGRLGGELARIHAIMRPHPGLGFLAEPEPTPALHSIQRFRGFLDHHPRPRPVLEWGLNWLERHAPPAGDIVLCHHDYRTGNLMLDETGLSGVLDWEFAGWSDPLEDLGWLCARCWRFGVDHLEAGGIGRREDFYRGYEEASGRTIERAAVGYWEVMAHVRWAVIAVLQAERHVSGAEPSLELALTAHVVPELELEILRMTGEGS